MIAAIYDQQVLCINYTLKLVDCLNSGFSSGSKITKKKKTNYLEGKILEITPEV